MTVIPVLLCSLYEPAAVVHSGFNFVSFDFSFLSKELQSLTRVVFGCEIFYYISYLFLFL